MRTIDMIGIGHIYCIYENLYAMPIGYSSVSPFDNSFSKYIYRILSYEDFMEFVFQTHVSYACASVVTSKVEDDDIKKHFKNGNVSFIQNFRYFHFNRHIGSMKLTDSYSIKLLMTLPAAYQKPLIEKELLLGKYDLRHYYDTKRDELQLTKKDAIRWFITEYNMRNNGCIVESYDLGKDMYIILKDDKRITVNSAEDLVFIMEKLKYDR